VYRFPISDDERTKAHQSIEALKRKLRFEEVIAKAICGRVLRITGWPFEVWEDRRPFIEEELRKHFNPVFCAAVSVTDTTRYHGHAGQDDEDTRAPLSRKGHDDIRSVMDEILRAIYPDLERKRRDEIRRGCEARLFFLLKNALPNLARRR